MGGDTTKQTTQNTSTAQQGTQTGQTTPYAPSQDLITQLLSNLGGTSSNLTPTETGALGNLTAQGAAGDPFAGQISDVAGSQLTGGPDRTGLINDAYSQYQKLLAPFAQGNYVDPSSNPQLQSYLDVARNDAANSVRSQFAGAGRDLSGYEQQAEARGVGQAEAPILYDAYNQGRAQQLSGISGLLSGGLSAASGLSAADAQRVATQNSGIGAASAANQASQYGPLLQLAAAAQQRGIPLQTLAQQFGLVLPTGQAFGTTSGTTNTTGTGTSTGTETTQVPLFDKLLSAGATGAALYGKLSDVGAKTGVGSSIFSGLTNNFLGSGSNSFSDIELKTGIRRVGRLDNGLPVYIYRYKSGGPPEIGLIAQDVEKVKPEAVGKRDGFKTVDYARAVT